MLPYSDSTNAYLYLKTDFSIPTDKINLTCLDLAINDTFLGSIYQFALTEEDDTHILFMFTRPLETLEELVLDDIVQSHTGTCVVPSDVAETKIHNASDYEVLTYDSTSQMFVNRMVDHDHLENLDRDAHTQYIPRDGSRGMEADWDAGEYEIRADGGFRTENLRVGLAPYANVSGVLTGGELTINVGDNTLVDIAAGTGIHCYFDPDVSGNPRVHIVSWDAQTIDPNLETSRSRWIAIQCSNEGDGTAVIKTEITADDRRQLVVLGRCWGPGTGQVTVAIDYKTPAYNYGKTLEDVISSLGSINISGNVYTPYVSLMKLQRTSGQSFRFPANYGSNPTSPNITTSPATIPENSYHYHIPGQQTTISRELIDPDQYYDDTTGTLIAVPTNKWTIQRVYYFPVSNNTHVTYGEDYFDSKSLAYDGILKNNVNLNKDILSGSILRVYLIIQQGCTSLSSSKCHVITAYTDPGLVPGFTNHAQLGGLEDDDHPQYHNDTRGDALYYRKSYIENSANILYGYEGIGTYPFNVKTTFDGIYSWISFIGYSGRVTPKNVLSIDSTNTSNINIAAGAGFISDGSYSRYVLWDSTSIVDAGYYTQGNWYIYVDSNGDVQTTMVAPTAFDIIRLGLFFTYEDGRVSTVLDNPCYINSSGNRIVNSLMALGPFISDESGQLQVSSNNNLAIIATQAHVHWALEDYVLPEIDSVDNIGIEIVRNSFQASDGKYYSDGWYSNPNGGNGVFPPDRWSDTTQDASSLIIASFVFTNGSSTVTVSGDYTGSISKDDFIYLQADGINQMCPIADSTTAVVFSGGTTTITLEAPYTGTSATGNAVFLKCLRRVDEGKFVKHIVFRVLDGDLIGVYGNEQFDSETDARYGALPDYPSTVKMYNVPLAYLIGTKYTTTWGGNIYDLRPLPFYREGGGGSGGGTVITSHSALSNLDADDHIQYLLTNGTRKLTSVQSYQSHPTFSADTQLVDKKYVDDYFPVDHTTLTNKGTNTHAQIDTHIADTTIHFTKASIDHNAITNTHNLTTNIDHNSITNTHNLTTNINHNSITNTHNLTTDIDHNQLTNYDANRHFLWSDITAADILGKIPVLYALSDTLSSTTSTTFQNKVTLSTPAVAGTYRVAYTMEFNAGQNNKDVQVQFYDNTNTTVLGENSQQTNNNANWFSFNGFYHFTQGATATQFILQYRAGTATCSVRNARIEIWRVS